MQFKVAAMLALLAPLSAAGLINGGVNRKCQTTTAVVGKGAVAGASQQFCLQTYGTRIPAGQNVTYTYTEDLTQVSLQLVNFCGEGSAFVDAYDCSTGLGLASECGDNVRTRGGSVQDGCISYVVKLEPMTVHEKLSASSTPHIHWPYAVDKATGKKQQVARAEQLASRPRSNFLSPIPVRDAGDERQAGGHTCSTGGTPTNSTRLESFIEAFCIDHIGDPLRTHEIIASTTSIGNTTVTLALSNQCMSDGGSVAHQACLDGLRSIATCGSDFPDFTVGGRASLQCLSFDVVVYSAPPIKPHHSPHGELIKRQVNNCINKADPDCQDCEYVCLYDGGLTVPGDLMKSAGLQLCRDNSGLRIEPWAWFNHTYTLDGKEVIFAIHNLHGKPYSNFVNHCQWAFDGIRQYCGDGLGSHAGYLWIWDFEVTWAVGVDGNMPDVMCGGAC